MVAAIAGGGNGFSSGLVMTLGADNAPADLRGPFLGVYRMVTGFGDILGPIVTGSLSQALSLKLNASITAAVGFFGAFWLILTVKETLVAPDAGLFQNCIRAFGKANAKGYEKVSCTQDVELDEIQRVQVDVQDENPCAQDDGRGSDQQVQGDACLNRQTAGGPSAL